MEQAQELKEVQREYRELYQELEKHSVRCTCTPCKIMHKVYERMVSLIEDRMYREEN